MTAIPSILLVLLTALLLHAAIAPGLHGLAAWLYRGRPSARPERGRSPVAFLLLVSSPLLVAAAGLSVLGHAAENGGAWDSVIATCRRLHEHCDFALAAGAELAPYSVVLLSALFWTGRAAWRALEPVLAIRRLQVVEPTGERRLRLRRAFDLVHPPVQVLLVSGPRGAAVTAGLLRPRILLSADVVDGLSAAQLAAVLAHESAHVQRLDGLRALAIRFAAALVPATPWSRRAERAHDLDREILCDAAAVAAGADPVALAEALVWVARLRPTATAHPAATGIYDVQRAVRTRVELLLSHPEDLSSAPSRRPHAAVLALLGAAALVYHAAFGLLVSVHYSVEAVVHFLA